MHKPLPFCVNKQSHVATRRRRACTDGCVRTYGEQHDRGTRGSEGGVCLFRKEEQSHVATRRRRACTGIMSREEKMVIKDVNLETVCGITSVIPLNLQPEFAFAGKSNVGKSSLINGLMNRKSYARISAEPGKTQTINFYHINDTFYLVDLPGYGYASRSKDDVRKWGTMVENYLHRSRMLRLVFLLIDIRHEPSENDHMMYDWILHQGFEPIIIATKADKIKKTQLQKQINLIRNSMGISQETALIPYSAVTKQGREEIYAVIEQNMQSEMTSVD